jgi:hypothetical protein
LKNVFVCWYGETTLEILKEKLIKSIKRRTHLNILIMHPLGIEILTNTKNSFQKDF